MLLITAAAIPPDTLRCRHVAEARKTTRKHQEFKFDKLDSKDRGCIYVAIGYLNDPVSTKTTIDEEGWLHTGDIGFINEDDELFIVNRLKEIIKYKGFQVALAEISALLLTHPTISDAAVVPMIDEKAGEKSSNLSQNSYVCRLRPGKGKKWRLLSKVLQSLCYPERITGLEIPKLIARRMADLCGEILVWMGDLSAEVSEENRVAAQEDKGKAVKAISED
ncbi:hypothetical protein ACET3Z_004940 [Daucus carota]